MERMNLRAWLVALVGLAFALPIAAQQGGGSVLARSAACVFTSQDFADILVMDGAVLQTPLTPAEQERGRQRILAQFHKNPDVFCKNMPVLREKAAIMGHGSPSDREHLGVELWSAWLLAAPFDPLAAEWVAVVKQHNPPVVAADGLSVSKLQLDALFASNDWVAQAANLPTSTPESRAAFQRELSTGFAALPRVQKERLAKADERWAALQDVILRDNDSRAKTVSVVRQKIHDPKDVPMAARVLEDIGVEFETVSRADAQRTIAVMGALGQAAQAQNLGVFNAHAPH
jgi:hypothetical protein